MFLGKRPRPPMKRTTSMTGITVDPTIEDGHEPSDHHHQYVQTAAVNGLHAAAVVGPQGHAVNDKIDNMNMNINNFGYHEDHRFLAILSPRNNQRRNSGSFDVVETAHFLRTCGLCKRTLASGRDIYMYRGDTAFCSLECREQQMKQDERVEKCKALGSKKEDRHPTQSTGTSASGKSQTVAAA